MANAGAAKLQQRTLGLMGNQKVVLMEKINTVNADISAWESSSQTMFIGLVSNSTVEILI